MYNIKYISSCNKLRIDHLPSSYKRVGMYISFKKYTKGNANLIQFQSYPKKQ